MQICRAVREAVGDEMVLMLDPFGVYTLEESIWVGHELEKLGYYWLEHPMIETRVEAYRRLCSELDIAICSPEHAPGGIFTRAEWVLQGASDMSRIDISYGGITGSVSFLLEGREITRERSAARSAIPNKTASTGITMIFFTSGCLGRFVPSAQWAKQTEASYVQTAG